MTNLLCADQIAIVTPTKGRHKQLCRLLETVSEQTVKVGQILIADGGGDAKELVQSFADRLPLQWLDCPQPGQIPQRNYALKFLHNAIRVVIYFDDDIQLDPDAIEILVDYWNAQNLQPGGVSFNITNIPAQSNGWFRRLFFMQTTPHGCVLLSGYNTPITGLEKSQTSQWLIGGATAWRRDVLVTHALPDLPSDWAICEDLIFSYPVSKSETLHVCAEAHVAHIDDVRTLTMTQAIQRGRAIVLWRYYFVTCNSGLSITAFFWMTVGQFWGRLLRVVRGEKNELGYAWGTLKALGTCFWFLLTKRDIRHALH